MDETQVELTGWHRDYARAVLRHALDPPAPRAVRAGRTPVYGADLQEGPVQCWAVLRTPAGRLLAAATSKARWLASSLQKEQALRKLMQPEARTERPTSAAQ